MSFREILEEKRKGFIVLTKTAMDDDDSVDAPDEEIMKVVG